MNPVFSPKTFSGKGFSGMGFELFFEISGIFFRAKGYGSFDSPRAIFCGVGDLPIVVGFKPWFKIFSYSCGK